ncbi:MAG: polysaccharide deacetylase family protein [Chloroflexota bacterium]
MDPLKPLRMVNRVIKQWRKEQMGRHLSLVRRIERIAPPTDRLVVAMTFDDGPTVAPARPGDGRGLTDSLLRALAEYGGHGTFDVIGTTADNYPDEEGALGTALWSGVKYDHYPELGQDKLAGVVNQPELARRILAEGHELSNHGYNHIAFGPFRMVYGSRSYLRDCEACVADIKRLHDYVRDAFGAEMKLSRPPHYIDNTTDRFDSYDVYARVGYNYMAASFDGGGWLPGQDYKSEVESMVAAVEQALRRDPRSLNGQIIFQKDGYNMAKRSPIVDALPRQLALLAQHGYRVLTVSELLAISPVTDVAPEDSACAPLRALLDAGYPVAYRDNTAKLDQPLTVGELAFILVRGAGGRRAEQPWGDVPATHPYCRSLAQGAQEGWLPAHLHAVKPQTPVSLVDLSLMIAARTGMAAGGAAASAGNGRVRRREALALLAEHLLN